MSLENSLSERKELMIAVISLLHETRDLFDTYGKDIFSTAYDRFGELENGLMSNQIRMVVIGEFSRGKSSFLNALLGMNQLPTAQQATTSINAFMYPLPNGEVEPYIEVHYFDEKKVERIPIDTSDVIAKWGTELDEDNADLRKNIERINIYMQHALLDLDLVLIDTPGLESIHQHHEEITRKAIDGAHVAIWVQSVDQLGGNDREWQFLKSSIYKKFHKFITVVNKWDLVIESKDAYDLKQPLEKREKEKLEKVKKNFRTFLTSIEGDDLEHFLENNLFGVSAEWALRGDDRQKSLSGLDKVTQRIQEICTGNEAKKVTIFTPLNTLLELQRTLKEHLVDTLTMLKDMSTFEEREREIEKFEIEIKNIEIAKKNASLEARTEHERLCKYQIESVHDNIVRPLEELKLYVANSISKEYVRGKIKRHETYIDLPKNIADEYNETLEKVNSSWMEQSANILQVLEDARSEYASSMNAYAVDIRNSLSTEGIALPDLQVEFSVDLHSIQEYMHEQSKLEDTIASNERKISEYEHVALENTVSDAQLQMAKSAYTSAQRRYENLGGMPNPIERTRQVKVEQGWVKRIFCSDEYRTETYLDSSNVSAWKESKAEAKQDLQEEKHTLMQIQREYEERTGRRMSAEMAQRKLEQKNMQHIAKQEALAAKHTEELARAVNEAYERLHQRTVGVLEKNILLLKTTVAKSIEAAFSQQLQCLSRCVDEQFIEPLLAKKQSREEAQKAFEQGKAEVEAKVQEYTQALDTLESISRKSKTFLPK